MRDAPAPAPTEGDGAGDSPETLTRGTPAVGPLEPSAESTSRTRPASRRRPRPKPTWLFAYVMGASIGGALGTFAGSFTVGWGVALAPLLTCAVFAIGLVRERDERFRHALRFVTAMTIAFLVVIVPNVLIDLAGPMGTASNHAELERKAALLRPILAESAIRWSVMAVAVPFAFWRIRTKPR